MASSMDPTRLTRVLGRSREGIHVLGSADVPAFLELTARDPVVNVFAKHRARTTNLEPRWLGGEVWGLFRKGQLLAGCHLGANLVPVGCDAEQAAMFARHALGHAPRQGRDVATLVGPRLAVETIWNAVADVWGEARDERWDQPHLQIARAPDVPPDSAVTPTRRQDLEILYPACVAMYREEVGADPESGGPRGLYRTRVEQLVGKGWSFSRIEGDQVVFKAEVACVSPYAAQVQGVWVNPRHRGRGLAAPGMAAVVEHVRRTIAPVVSLYVNAWNTPARRAYDAVGFEQTATFATVMF